MITREIKKLIRRRILARPYFWRSKSRRTSVAPSPANVIFVSHEATLTGAPKIILGLLREFSECTDVSCTTILNNDGYLIDEFAKYSDVHCLEVSRKRSSYSKRMIKGIVKRSGDRTKPTIALVNSAESRFIADALQDIGVPVVSLIHELPYSYTKEDFELIAEKSDRVIFPAEFVRKAAVEFTKFDEHRVSVIPQGLIDPEFGSRWNREQAKQQLHQEVGVPEDAKVVLGCGSIDMRKGVDFFVSTARIFLKKYGQASNTHFVWVGDGPRWCHSPYHFLNLDLDRSGIKNRVHFLGQRPNVEPYFVAADAALMVSREDPFPCVVHEAMACGVPTIAFQGAGGAPECLAEGAGIIIPYGDCEAAAYELHRLETISDYHRCISNRALQRVESEYCFSDYFHRVAGVMQSVLGIGLDPIASEFQSGPDGYYVPNQSTGRRAA